MLQLFRCWTRRGPRAQPWHPSYMNFFILCVQETLHQFSDILVPKKIRLLIIYQGYTTKACWTHFYDKTCHILSGGKMYQTCSLPPQQCGNWSYFSYRAASEPTVSEYSYSVLLLCQKECTKRGLRHQTVFLFHSLLSDEPSPCKREDHYTFSGIHGTYIWLRPFKAPSFKYQVSSWVS